MRKTYYVYILASWSRRLYIGVTSNITRRLDQHRTSESGHTGKYKITRLVYYKEFGDVNAAIAREKQLKGWIRAKKIALIENENPTWKDLSEDWF